MTDNVTAMGLLPQCRTCFQPDQWRLRRLEEGPGCPLLVAAVQGELPPQWRNGKCADHVKQPPVYRYPRAKAEGVQGGMFDEPERRKRQLVPLPHEDALFSEPGPAARALVPVDGWPDYRTAGRGGGVDGTA